MNLYRSGLLRCAVVAALVAAASIAAGILAARAEDYPTRPVKIIVQTAAGSSLDAMGRLVAEQLSQLWGKEVLVINQAGAGGLNAARATADAVADGYTLFLAGGSVFVALPVLHRDLPFDVNAFVLMASLPSNLIRFGVEQAGRSLANGADRALQIATERLGCGRGHDRWLAAFDRRAFPSCEWCQDQLDPLSGHAGGPR